MHFDLPMDLYEKRHRANVLAVDYEPFLRAGGISLVGAAIYVEDHYLPEMALRVALGQVARLYAEVEANPNWAIVRAWNEIEAARAQDKLAVLITMEGVEPLGTDINLLRVFYQLGLRSLGLTHARRNMAGDGGVFAPSGSSRQGLAPFGRDVVAACEAFGIIVDLAHLNPAGIDDVLAMTHRPPVFSHTNPRRFYNIERNASDEHIIEVGRRGGVIGINSVLVSETAEHATLDGYIDHVEYVAELAGIEHVGIGFDFFDFIWRGMPPREQEAIRRSLADIHFVPELLDHSHAPNLVRRLAERGWPERAMGAFLYGNWLRLFEQML
jgi:membrane dipeptidase